MVGKDIFWDHTNIPVETGLVLVLSLHKSSINLKASIV